MTADINHILAELIGGVALLLWGVRMVRTAVTRAYGASLRQALGRLAGNRLSAAAAGLGATAVLQSSTATALIVSSFASRGLIAAPAALAVMLGADVGSTLIAQVLSVGVGWLWPLLLTCGIAAFLATESGLLRRQARLAIGLGLMLLALSIIVQASSPLRQFENLPAVLAPLAASPLLAFAVAALLTWLAHSSIAVVLLVMSLAGTGVIAPPLALAFVLGANFGGALAPLVATAGAARAARRVPLGNLLMRGAAALAVLPLIDRTLPWLAMVEADPARLAVNAHTAFNLALALVFLPLVGPVAALCRRLLPDERIVDEPSAPRYLDEEALATPAVALACAARETLRMGDVVERMLRQTIAVFRTDDERLARETAHEDDTVDRLHEAIKLYLTRLSQEEFDPQESRRYVEVLTFTTNLEHIGDIIDKNLIELAGKKIRNRLAFSPEGLAEITAFHERVLANLQLAFNVFMSSDVRLARRLLEEKVAIRDAELRATETHLARVAAGRVASIETSSLHLDIIRDLKRISSHAASVAYPILDAAGELRASRLRTIDSRSEPEPGIGPDALRAK